jgi:pimeloyl-ACP methyl ester carboxylesterase
MAAIRERRLDLGGRKTRVLELEADDDSGHAPVVLLHGWSDSADTWRPLLALLARRGRAALALDLPGFGHAERLAEDEPVLDQLDAFTAAAVEHLAARCGEEVVIVGNSLGGCAALRAAENDELPIAGVMPVAPAGLAMARWFRIVEGERLVRLLLSSPIPLPELVVREAVGRVYRVLAFASPGQADPAVVASFTRHLGTQRALASALEIGRRLFGELADPFRLDRVSCPVLLVWGDRDRMVFSTGADRVLREVPGSQIEVIERCGHCPQLEATQRLADLLDGFDAEVRAGGAARTVQI